MTGKGFRVANSYSALNRTEPTKRGRKNTGLTGKDARKNIQLKFYYGISLADYNQMFEDQNGCCKLCNRHQSEIKGKLNVDHCHNSKTVRALLCNQCNQALGLVKENPITIKNMLIVS